MSDFNKELWDNIKDWIHKKESEPGFSLNLDVVGDYMADYEHENVKKLTWNGEGTTNNQSEHDYKLEVENYRDEIQRLKDTIDKLNNEHDTDRAIIGKLNDSIDNSNREKEELSNKLKELENKLNEALAASQRVKVELVADGVDGQESKR